MRFIRTWWSALRERLSFYSQPFMGWQIVDFVLMVIWAVCLLAFSESMVIHVIATAAFSSFISRLVHVDGDDVLADITNPLVGVVVFAGTLTAWIWMREIVLLVNLFTIPRLVHDIQFRYHRYDTQLAIL